MKKTKKNRLINPMLWVSIVWWISFIYVVIKEVIPPLEELPFRHGVPLLFMMLFSMLFFGIYIAFFIVKEEDSFFYWLKVWSLGGDI